MSAAWMAVGKVVRCDPGCLLKEGEHWGQMLQKENLIFYAAFIFKSLEYLPL